MGHPGPQATLFFYQKNVKIGEKIDFYRNKNCLTVNGLYNLELKISLNFAIVNKFVNFSGKFQYQLSIKLLNWQKNCETTDIKMGQLRWCKTF
jgi:hypothetical protein